jgi:hypothetical protein
VRVVRVLGVVFSVAVTVAVVASGCSRASEPVVVPDVPRFSTAPPSSAAGVQGRPVPTTCAEVLTPEEVGTILGMLITGEPLPVVGVPLPDIGRTARLDCYYGLRPGRPESTATVWIGLTSYTDARAAQRRLTSTISAERDAGSQVNEVPVGSGSGVLLRGTMWTLVAQRGRTTVVVTIKPNLVREDRAGAMLGQLADKSLTPREPTPG